MTKNYNIDEACELAGISRALMYKLWAENCGPRKFKIGRRTFVSGDALQSWLKQLEKKAGGF